MAKSLDKGSNSRRCTGKADQVIDFFLQEEYDLKTCHANSYGTSWSTATIGMQRLKL